jgi:hypothetical protein
MGMAECLLNVKCLMVSSPPGLLASFQVTSNEKISVQKGLE